MIAVTDSSPLNYLVQLHLDHVLAQLFQIVLVPDAVLRELQHSRAPSEVQRWAASPPEWAQCVTVESVDERLPAALDPGESEAISLALRARADILLIDERAGRLASEALQLNIAGTLAVLLEASLREQLDFTKVLKQLRQLRFRLDPRLEAYMLRRYQQLRDLR